MACFSIAVIQARLEPKVVAEILGSDRALEALRRHVEALVGQQATVVTRAVSHRPGQRISCIQAGAVVVNLFDDKISVQSASLGRLALQNLTGQIESKAQGLALALQRERLAAAVRSKYLVKSDQVLSNGARVLKITV